MKQNLGNRNLEGIIYEKIFSKKKGADLKRLKKSAERQSQMNEGSLEGKLGKHNQLLWFVKTFSVNY